jgi:hypothetical protein
MPYEEDRCPGARVLARLCLLLGLWAASSCAATRSETLHPELCVTLAIEPESLKRVDADGSKPISAPFESYADYGARLEVSAAGETTDHDVGLCTVRVDADGSVWAGERVLARGATRVRLVQPAITAVRPNGLPAKLSKVLCYLACLPVFAAYAGLHYLAALY